MINDTEMLDWVIFHSAWVNFDSDGEACWVVWCDRDGDYKTSMYYNTREAIIAAMQGKFNTVGGG